VQQNKLGEQKYLRLFGHFSITILYNKISSAKMSDAKILYKLEGDVDRATEQA
jgi:hypothetical protein